jgi:hypothetical protein
MLYQIGDNSDIEMSENFSAIYGGNSPWYIGMRSLTMLIEMESTDLITDIQKMGNLSTFPKYLGIGTVLSFYFFMSLVFINLLNAYAVANVAKIEAKAETSKRLSKVETILFFEKCLQTIYKALGSFGRKLWVSSNS